MEEQTTSKEDSHNFDSVIFIGGQHLTDIREIKNHQRSITFQYIIIVIAIAGLSKLQQAICISWIKAIITIFGIFVIGFIWAFQNSLSDFRKRIYKIWEEPYFKQALEKEFLNVDKKDPKKYYSFTYQSQYPLIYSLLVLMVMVSLLFIL